MFLLIMVILSCSGLLTSSSQPPASVNRIQPSWHPFVRLVSESLLLCVSFATVKGGKVSFKLFSIGGQLLAGKSTVTDTGHTALFIPVGYPPKGIYLRVLKNDRDGLKFKSRFFSNTQ